MPTDWMWVHANPKRAAVELDMLGTALRNLVEALDENDQDGLTGYASEMHSAHLALVETGK